jgi:hypothetical protein
MKKRKQEDNGLKKWITAKLAAILGSVVVALAFGGWATANFIHEELASKDAVVVAQVKADHALDLHLQSLMDQKARLQAKQRKSSEDVRQIDYLQREIDRLRQIRSGK